AREFEGGRVQPLVLHVRSEHRGSAIACVLSAVGYLEAGINEFFSNAVDEDHGVGVAAAPAVIERLRTLWHSSSGKTTILDKYDLALGLSDVATFDKGSAPYQGVAKLIR